MNELRRDESDITTTDDASVMTYSYQSTWSTNYTMSNLPGPGRNLGNLLLKAGAALERRLVLWRIINRAALKAEKEAARKAQEEAVEAARRAQEEEVEAARRAQEEVRRALEAARRAQEKAVDVVRRGVSQKLLSDDPRIYERACEALLICAKYVFLSSGCALLIRDATFEKIGWRRHPG